MSRANLVILLQPSPVSKERNRSRPAKIGLVEPRFTVTYVEPAKQRYTLGGKHERLKPSSVRPTAIAVSIELPRLKSASGIDLDVNESRLKLEKTGLYKLDFELPFSVDSDNGSA